VKKIPRAIWDEEMDKCSGTKNSEDHMLSKFWSALPFPQILLMFKRLLVNVVFEKYQYS